MWSEIICLVFGVLLGIFLTLGAWIGYDKVHQDRLTQFHADMEEALFGSDFCQQGCGFYENCHERTKDSETAMDELEHNYCFSCPLKLATDVLDKYQDVTKIKGVNRDEKGNNADIG